MRTKHKTLERHKGKTGTRSPQRTGYQVKGIDGTMNNGPAARAICAYLAQFKIKGGDGMRVMLLLAALVATASAYTGYREIVVPSGESGFSIRCDEGINACYEEAGEVCHRGYTVITTNTQAGFEAQASSSYIGPDILPAVGSSSSTARTTADNGLIIQCKEPEITAIERVERQRLAREAREARQHRESMRLLSYLGGVAAAVATLVTIVILNS